MITTPILALVHTSIINIILMMALLLAWAKLATIIDKDAEFFFIDRQKWNMINIGGALIAFFLWLFVPIPGWFFVGLCITPIILIAILWFYTQAHNEKAPPNMKWEFSVNTFKKMIDDRKAESAKKDVSFHFLANHGPKDPPPPQDEAKFATYLKIQDMFDEAYKLHAQTLNLSVGEKGVKVVLMIDGVERLLSGHTGQEVLNVIDYLKHEAELDVKDRRKKQKGQIEVMLEEHGRHKMRILTSGNTKMLHLQIMFDPNKQVAIPFQDIGLEKDQIAALDPILANLKGLVLVASPPQQGLTTTLNSFLQKHDPYMTDIHSITSEIEYDLEGVHQNLIKPEGLARTIDDIMLYDPNVVMIELLTDQQAALLSLEAAKQARIYAGIRANDTFKGLKLWLKTIGNVEAAVEPLQAIVTQRLVRRLCDACKQSYKPDHETLRKMNLPANKINKFYKDSGFIMTEKNEKIRCPNCAGIGYRGRIGVYEVMPVDDEAKQYLINGDFKRFQSHLRKNRMITLQEAALAKVISGVTSISEATRGLDGKSEEEH